MNINNLKVGTVLKNYKALCELLEIPYSTSGKTKSIQVKEITQYFSYHKIEGSQEIMIDKIYETKIEKEDLRKLGSRSKYINEIGDILVDYLYEKGKAEDKYSTTLSLGQTLEILGMVNPTYATSNRHRRETAQVLDMDIFCVHYFFNNTRSEYRKIVERALNNLHSRRVLNWNKCIQICEKHDGNKIYRKATKEEEERVINIEKNVLKSLEIRNMQELFFSGKYRKFNKLVMEHLPENWVFYFYAYDLTIGDEAIKIEKKLIEQSRINLNRKSTDKAIKLLKAEEGKDEYKLIEVLINLLNYDLDLDDSIIEQYKKNYLVRFAKEWVAHGKYTEELDKIESEFNGDINMYDYWNYTINNKNKSIELQ